MALHIALCKVVLSLESVDDIDVRPFKYELFSSTLLQHSLFSTMSQNKFEIFLELLFQEQLKPKRLK